MRMMRPFIWLAIGFVFLPILYLTYGFFSIGSNAEPIELPVAAIATFCLYLFAADFGWTLIGRTVPLRLVGAAGAVVLLGYGVPAVVNANISGKSREVASADAAPVTVGTPQVIALLTPYEQTRDKGQVETDCEILCQRLLYWGNRKAVLMGATPPDGMPATAVGLVRYSIERRTSCPPIKVPEASVMPGQMQYGNSYATSETVQRRNERGECLIAEPGPISEADIAAIKSEPDTDDWLASSDHAGPLAVWRSSVFLRIDGGWTKVGQATSQQFSRVRSPLGLRIGGFFPSILESQEDQAAPSDFFMIEHMLAPWLGWPQGMPGGSQGPNGQQDQQRSK